MFRGEGSQTREGYGREEVVVVIIVGDSGNRDRCPRSGDTGQVPPVGALIAIKTRISRLGTFQITRHFENSFY
jgi:hypothetical protein